MSLRLRILLLIAAVNVGALLLVVWLGLQAAADVEVVGPAAVEEALGIAHAENPAEFPRQAVSFLVRLGGPGEHREPEIVAPPELMREAEAQRDRLVALLEEGEPRVRIDRRGLTVVEPEGGRRWSAWHAGFNEYAHREAIRNLQRVYVLLCVSTVLLIAGTYLILRRVVLGPLERLMEASQAVARGQAPVPIPRPRGDDEVARLIDTFNRMAAEVHEYQQHLEERVMAALHRVRAAEGRLVVAQRLAATGTLAAGFAHEINNPVGGIGNALRKLREGGLPPERQRAYLDLVLDGVNRIRTIVERILHFTPRQAGPTVLDVGDICRRAAALARHRAERRGVAVEVEAASPIEGVVGDPQELTQAVLNLVLNAIDAIPEGRGGTARISVRTEEQDAIIEVEDDGIGMDDETVHRCVDFFFSTKPEGEGTGLGLAIVQHIATDHGGALEIDSRKGVGTKVRIRLPRSPEP